MLGLRCLNRSYYEPSLLISIVRFVLPVVPSGDSQSGDFIECNAWPAERPLPLPVLILNRYVVECL